VRKGTYTAILFSLVVHGIIILLIFITHSHKEKSIKKINKSPPIKSFLYYAPNLTTAQANQNKQQPLKKIIEEPNRSEADHNKQEVLVTEEPITNKPSTNKPAIDLAAKNPVTPLNKAIQKPSIPSIPSTINNTLVLPKASNTVPDLPLPLPTPSNQKLDSFTQLQRLRSKLNNGSAPKVDNPYQHDQPPSIFNTTTKTVPHSAPLKDEEKEREKNTKNMGAGIAIIKGDDGRCSVTQDMSAYGLSEGSSVQFFSCGESKFDKSFREHMKAVKEKLGKN
tara:strand:+ start:14294 stop:15130 length:837 start_codon:yes stop_codon:yes gene_type:complete